MIAYIYIYEKNSGIYTLCPIQFFFKKTSILTNQDIPFWQQIIQITMVYTKDKAIKWLVRILKGNSCVYSILSTDTPKQDAVASGSTNQTKKAADSQGSVDQIINETEKLSFKEWEGFQKVDKCSVAASMNIECLCIRCYDVGDYINDNILFNDEEYMMEYMEKYMEWNTPHNILHIRKLQNSVS